MEELGNFDKELTQQVELATYELQLFAILGSTCKRILQEENVIIAGGCITSLFSDTKINDIDCYCRSEESFMRVQASMRSAHASLIVGTKAAMTYRFGSLTVQLIKLPNFFCETPQQVYSQFDFTICKAAYDFKTRKFELHPLFLLHLTKKALVFDDLKPLRPFNTYFRIEKYKARGYTMSKTETFKYLLLLSNTPITSYEQMESEIVGFSSALGHQIKDKLKEKISSNEPFDKEVFINLLFTSERETLQIRAGITNDAVELTDLPF